MIGQKKKQITNKKDIIMRKSNYDKQPATRIAGQLWKGWQAVRDEINRRCASLVGKKSVVVVVECYQGVHHEELTRELSA